MAHQDEQGRVERLGASIGELQGFASQLPTIEGEVLALAGVAARLGLRLLDRGPRSITVTLRRHEYVAIRETVTLLEHISGLKRGGITPPDMEGIRTLVQSRKEALEAALLSAEEMDMIRIEPGLDLRLKTAQIDGERAISEFLERTGREDRPEPEPVTEAREQDASLFVDYVSGDLPPDARLEAQSRIMGDPLLKRYTHDELIVITKLRQVIQKIDGYAYGVAARRRPLFSRARRNVLWSVPRIGAVMVTHLPSWRRQPEIGHLLLDLRRYEQHMKDLAMVPEDDDWFTGDDPLVRAVRQDAWRIHLRGVRIVSELHQGPSAHRFDDAFFDIFPGGSANYTDRFIELATPLTNAMAFAGICGRGERDIAMTAEELAEVERGDQEQGGLLGTIRDFFT